jgi:hypothetical protein
MCADPASRLAQTRSISSAEHVRNMRTHTSDIGRPVPEASLYIRCCIKPALHEVGPMTETTIRKSDIFHDWVLVITALALFFFFFFMPS